MNGLTNRNDWIFGECGSVITNKQLLHRQLVTQMLNRTIRMFEYENLPETIPQKDLELQLQVGGFAIFHKVKDELYSFQGGLGGKPNVYYLPTVATVANPALSYSKNLEIGKECVVVRNDELYQGLMPLNNKYAEMLAEAEISLRYASINARVPALIEADNEGTYQSALAYFNKVVEGKEYGVVSSGEFFDGIRSHDFYKVPHIKELIEAIQYLKGSWLNELGINAAFNMKREAINEAEAMLNEDMLVPSVDTMLECRELGLKKVNEMYGTNISVKLSSVWANNRKQDKIALDILKKEAGDTDDADDTDDQS